MYKSAASAADKDAMEQIGKNINNNVLEGNKEMFSYVPRNKEDIL